MEEYGHSGIPSSSARVDLHLFEGTFASAEEEARRHFILRKYSSGFIFLVFPYASLEVGGATSTTLLSAVVFFSILHRLYDVFYQDGRVSLFIASWEGVLLACECLSPPVTCVVPTLWIMSMGFLSSSAFRKTRGLTVFLYCHPRGYAVHP